MSPTIPPCAGDYATLGEHMDRNLDDVQRDTRSLVRTPSCPPSGRGSDRQTLPAPAF